MCVREGEENIQIKFYQGWVSTKSLITDEEPPHTHSEGCKHCHGMNTHAIISSVNTNMFKSYMQHTVIAVSHTWSGRCRRWTFSGKMLLTHCVRPWRASYANKLQVDLREVFNNQVCIKIKTLIYVLMVWFLCYQLYFGNRTLFL